MEYIAGMIYNFFTQLAIGKQGEDTLDRAFSRWYDIYPASIEQERLGIDRLYVRKNSLDERTVEYKTDKTAGRTGNAFIETISVDSGQTRKPGWAVSSQADYVFYFVPEHKTVFVLQMAEMPGLLRRWTKYKTVRCENDGYCSVGLLVPLKELSRAAFRVVALEENYGRPN